MSRRTITIALALVAAAGVGLALGATLFGGDDGDDGDSGAAAARKAATAGDAEPDARADRTVDTLPPPPAVPTEGLAGAALELAQAINEAAALEYHAVYRSNPPPRRPGDPPTTITVELWRRLPRARRDTTIVGSKELRTQEYRLFDRLVGCIDASAGSDFVCLDQGGKVDPSDVVLGAVKPSDGPVVAGEETVLNMRARCFSVLAPGSKPKRVCFDADGIPLLIDGGDGRLERLSVERTVSNSAFVPPKSRPG